MIRKNSISHAVLVIAFVAWIALWLMFTARELFFKNGLKDYKVLIHRPLEGKRSYVTGDRLYEFLDFCNNQLSGRDTYELIGLEDGSIEKRRAVYYLYPNLEKTGADNLIIYDVPFSAPKGYKRAAVLDETRYILRKKKER
ncbi:MAG: hypothetical protein PHP46_05350 [Candidatus Omnitrophica bacterium]|nr:hypothetical protein [Candidatus Omnitrophota bacterium]